ncbi:MAG: protein kinase [Deltaproteobacteria bacterium]|nr:protein kinase [Deltaproteobacteria bacterium]
MAEIFVARLKGVAGFEKQVVIKRILPHLVDEDGFVQMVLDEARIAARISHPNVCQVYELGEVDGQYFIAMEYLEGTSLMVLLKKLIRLKQNLEPALVAGVIAQACEGLHHAHELKGDGGESIGVVHRDVSPQNLFLTGDGVVKVLDFGIAKAAGASAKTRTGTVKGKYAYMSPEQLKGEALDRRSDVFALGVVTYEALTVKRLFYRETDFLIFKAIAEEDIPQVRTVRPDVPGDLNDTVARALSRARDARFASARAYGDAITRAVSRIGGVLGAAQIGEVVRALMGEEMAAERALIAAASALPDDGAPVVHSQPVEGEVARPAKLPLPAPPLTPPPVRLAEISLQLALPAGVLVGSGLRKRRPSEDDTAEDSVAGTRDPTVPTGVGVHNRDTRPGGSDVGEPVEAPDTAVGDDVSDSAARSAAGFDIQIDPELGGDEDGDGAPAGSSSVSASSLKATAPQGVPRLSALRQPSGDDYGDQSVVEPSVVEVGPEPRRRVWLYALMGGLALAVVAAWALWPKTTRPVQAREGSSTAAGATAVAGTRPGGGSGGLGGAAALPSPLASPLPEVSPIVSPEASAAPLPSPSPVVSPGAGAPPVASASPSPVASAPPSPSTSAPPLASPSPRVSASPRVSVSPRVSASPSASASASPRPSSSPSARDPSPKPDRRPERSPSPVEREPSESPRASSPSGPPGTFSIDAEPYATIFIDGKKVGDTPLYKLPLAPGKHKVRAVSAAGTQNFSIEVQPGQALPPRKLRFGAPPP